MARVIQILSALIMNQKIKCSWKGTLSKQIDILIDYKKYDVNCIRHMYIQIMST